jgi:hypothetical protein
MIMPRHLPPHACFDDPAANLDRVASDQTLVFALAGFGITRVQEWIARGDAKQRGLRSDLVTLCICPQMLPSKRPSASWCAREHGVSRQWACRLQQEFARELGDYIRFRGQRFQMRRGRMQRVTRGSQPDLVERGKLGFRKTDLYAASVTKS